EDGIRDGHVTGVQTCALPISAMARYRRFDTARAATMTVSDAIERGAIESVRLRREGLRSAMSTLERALAAPAPSRVDEWRNGVQIGRASWRGRGGGGVGGGGQ